MTFRLVAALVLAVAPKSVAQQAPSMDVLHGSVTDANGAPVAGAVIEVHRRPTQGIVCLDLVASRSTRKVQTMRTGKNGSFAAQLPRGVPFDLVVDDGVHAPVRRREVYAGEQLALPLVPAARVTVTLRDDNGAPSPGGVLEAWDRQHVRWVDGTIDEHGRWTSDRLPPGPMTFDIAPAAGMRPEWHKVDLVAGETTPLEFTLAPGCRLRGRVTDADTGKPIAGARIGEGWTMDKFVVSDADGRYEMRGYGSSGYGEVRVTASGYGPALRSVAFQADGVTQDFTLTAGRPITGRIVDVDGKPVAGAYVAAVGGSFSGGDDTHDWCSGTTDADGRFRLTGARTTVVHGLHVRADGLATLVADLPTVPTSGLQLPDLAMRAPRYVSGVVVDGGGVPIVGVEVSLSGANPDRGTLFAGAAMPGSNPGDYCIAARSMKTDSLGRIHFADVPPGQYTLYVGSDHTREAIGIEVKASVDPDPVRVVR